MVPDLPGIELGALGDEAAPDIGSQVEAIRSLGWPGIELRTVGGRQVAQLHPAAFARVVASVAVGGLRTVAVSSGIGGWQRTTSTPQELDLRELVTAVDSPALLLLVDIGNCVAHDQDPVEFLAAVLPWVAHVHVKDGVRSAGGVRWVTPGTGDARVEECLAMHLGGSPDVINVLGKGPSPSRDRVGGKALGLDRLVRAGALVPELADTVAALEARLGTELDVEAAHDGRSWWLVQARAIST